MADRVTSNEGQQRFLRRAVYSCSLAILAVAVVDALSPERQWDFAVYFEAARAYFGGGNPYAPIASVLARPGDTPLPFVYPLASLYPFRPFLYLSFPAASHLFLALKLAVLAGLMILWRRHFVRGPAQMPLLVAVTVLGYGGAVLADLQAGNVSLFEQMLLWSGFVCLLRGRAVPFCVLVASAGIFKLTPALLLPLVLTLQDRRRWWLLVVSLAAIGAVTLLPYSAHPGYAAGLRANWSTMREGGHSNPCAYALIQDGVALLLRSSGIRLPYLPQGAYAAFVVFLLGVSWRTARRARLHERSDEVLFLSLFVFALALPRFKDYSYVLLLVPSIHVISSVLRTRRAKVVAVAAVCSSFYGYASLLTAGALFAVFLRHLHSRLGAKE